MSETQNWLMATIKLREATQSGAANWTVCSSESFVQCYETTFLGRIIRLGMTKDGRMTLYFADSSGKVLFEFPQNEALPHLFMAVQRQAVHVDDFLEEVLAFNP